MLGFHPSNRAFRHVCSTVGTPIWSLIDPTNPASGGVQLKYSSVVPDADSPNQCGNDPVTSECQRQCSTRD